ncbi:MAG: hypothetical protein WC755_02560 [Candidatus Woesearchaeota archaeon]|jgi:hypothetical protein
MDWGSRSLARSVEMLRRSYYNSKFSVKPVSVEAGFDAMVAFGIMKGILKGNNLPNNESSYNYIVKELDYCVDSINVLTKWLDENYFSKRVSKPISQFVYKKLTDSTKSSTKSTSVPSKRLLVEIVRSIVHHPEFPSHHDAMLSELGKELKEKLYSVYTKNIMENRFTPNVLEEYDVVHKVFHDYIKVL